MGKIQSIKNALRKKSFLIAVVIIILISTGLITTAGFFTYYNFKELNKQILLTKDKAKEVNNSLKQLDFESNKVKLANLKEELIKTHSSYEKLSYLGKTPFVSSYYQEIKSLLEAANEGVEAAEILNTAISSELKKINFVPGSANVETFIPTLLKIMPHLSETVPQIEGKIKNANEKVKNINTKHYPERLKNWEVRSIIESAKHGIESANQILPQFKDILTVLPNVLGSDKTKTYLLLFQNDKELRSTGGFITAYAVALIQQGRLVYIKSDDIYNVDDEIKGKLPAPEHIRKYLNVTELHLRDTNISPDFPTFVADFKKLYDRYSPSDSLDGVIALDTEFLLKVIDLLGPIKTKRYNEEFSTKINEQYGIPDALYKLELYSENLLSQKENRKELIGDLMDSMLAKFFKQPFTTWPKIIEEFFNLAQRKHIIANLNDKGAQKLLEQNNFAGVVKDYDGDYFFLVENNFSSKKANLYIKEKIDKDLKIETDGTLTKVVTITLTNPKPNDSWLNSNYLDYMRFYLPKGSELIKTTLEDVKTFEELGKTVVAGKILVPTQNSKSLTISYKLPFKLKEGEEYKLLLQKQPGAADPEINLFINGKKLKVNEFDVPEEKGVGRLQKDTEIKFKP